MGPDEDAANEVRLLIADLFEAAGAVRRHGDRIASLAGQTQARWQLLSVLSEGDWTVPRAARRLGVSRQAVQRTVDVLHADGLVELDPNPDHQRSPLLRLTGTGNQALTAISGEGQRWNETVASSIDAHDLATTRAVLRILIDST